MRDSDYRFMASLMDKIVLAACELQGTLGGTTAKEADFGFLAQGVEEVWRDVRTIKALVRREVRPKA